MEPVNLRKRKLPNDVAVFALNEKGFYVPFNGPICDKSSKRKGKRQRQGKSKAIPVNDSDCTDKPKRKERKRADPNDFSYLVYFLASTINKQRTYVGSTVLFSRRIRQHNGELANGANATKGNRPWAPFVHITGLNSKQSLQLEKAIKMKRVGGHSGPTGRMRTLEKVIGLEKWTSKSTPMPLLPPICIKTVYTEQDYKKLAGVKNFKNYAHVTRKFEQELK